MLKITYDQRLPIVQNKDKIIRALLNNQIIIIAGETGSGKTTQLPKFCLEAGRGIRGTIACTQPRRIAAITVCDRIAEELGESPGQSVGYKIRFQEKKSTQGYIKIMTDGILLAETQKDRFLNKYDTIIVDEAHERSLNIDFMLGFLKNLLKKRKDLKLIITSATIDTQKFSRAFENAPVIEVSGRVFPVKLEYFQNTFAPNNAEEPTFIEMTGHAADKLVRIHPMGDILIFMPTEQDIRETCELLNGRQYKDTTVLPLFARLEAAKQKKIFSQFSGRKIIVATNVAETSLTIPGIKYVIDTGLARISQYSPSSRTTALPVMSISKSSADQRKGRCGRVTNGLCLRLFSQKDYENRSLFTKPEILRSNLAEVILRMIALKLGDIRNFPFIDQPTEKSIQDGYKLLLELGAIIKKQRTGKKSNGFCLTANGRLMAKLPIDPRLSRMLIQSVKSGCLKEVIIIAAALSIRDPRERPIEKIQAADQAHAAFNDPLSDFISLLNIWRKFSEFTGHSFSLGKVKKFCKTHFLSFRRMREWRDIHRQIELILKEHGLIARKTELSPLFSSAKNRKEKYSPLYTAIHQAILAGFLSNIAVKKDKHLYKGSKDRKIMIFPGSGLFKSAGDWIVAAELVETTRLYAHKVATIDSNWLEALGKEQCKYTYIDPHWEKKQGRVIAYEQVFLYGLPIVQKRHVSFGKIDPEKAAQIFIRQALIPGQVAQKPPFLKHNLKLIDEIKDLENRFRRRDIFIDEIELEIFYQERLTTIFNMPMLIKFIKKKKDDQFLRMNRQSLLRYLPNKEEMDLYPDQINLGNKAFRCSYQFDSSRKDDGLTVKIPVANALQVPKNSLDWLVPGLLKEKITTLIKGLPKEYRKKLLPLDKTVEIISREMHPAQCKLVTALSRFIKTRFGVIIQITAWPTENLPDHLKTRIEIIAPDGKLLNVGRKNDLLNQKHVAITDQGEFENAKKPFEKKNITSWDFGDLKKSIILKGSMGNQLIFYPALYENDKKIELTLLSNHLKAIKTHKQGVMALFSYFFKKDLKFLKTSLSLPQSLKEACTYFGGLKKLDNQLYQSVVSSLFCKNIRSQKTFLKILAEFNETGIHTRGETRRKNIIAILKEYHLARKLLSDLLKTNGRQLHIRNFLSQMQTNLENLIPANFILLYEKNTLFNLNHYIKAIITRSQRGVDDLVKDQIKAEEAEFFSKRLTELIKDLSPETSSEKRKALEDFFWLIEEYKISLFAQELKTTRPVSKKRMLKRLNEIKLMG